MTFEITVLALVLGASSILLTGSIAIIALIEITREKSK